jgi:hypothetical protein
MVFISFYQLGAAHQLDKFPAAPPKLFIARPQWS